MEAQLWDGVGTSFALGTGAPEVKSVPVIGPVVAQAG